MSPNNTVDLSSAKIRLNALDLVIGALLDVFRNGGQLPKHEDGEPDVSTLKALAIECGKYATTEESIEEAVELLKPHFPEISHLFI